MRQRAALFDTAAAYRDWCARVADRRKEVGWAEDDPVAVAARQAQAALHALLLAVSASGPTHPPMTPPATRAETMAARKRDREGP
jgi:hypothetical protein